MTLKSISVALDPTQLIVGQDRDGQTPDPPEDGVFYRLPGHVIRKMFPEEAAGCDVFYGNHRSVAYCATIVGYRELGVLAKVLDTRKRPPPVAEPSILVLAFSNKEARDAFRKQGGPSGCTCWPVECGED